ncbi:MAG: dihydrofolate reductase family protein [Pseudomonadota bacterium]|nr:dihydrofolate reductase family protein [Pseudomonadota bacterium]
MTIVQQLLPAPGGKKTLAGLYLAHALHELGSLSDPFVYGNFLSSLDGRISLVDAGTNEPYLPKTLTNANDYRLFLELHAQCDCLITHGGYLRSMMSGKLGNILQVGTTSESTEFLDWRTSHGLAPQPAIAIASTSLEFPIPPSIRQHEQPCYIVTTARAERQRVLDWEDAGYPVIVVGDGKMVSGQALVEALRGLGYFRMYLIAGPHMLDTMIREQQLSRLYQTVSLQLLGGETFHTMIPGIPLGEKGQMQLRELYYDPGNEDQCAQFFTSFDPIRPSVAGF